jgi:hypothetical protein
MINIIEYLLPLLLFLNNFFDLRTSNARQKVLDDHYLDPNILSAVEKAALDVRIFG